MPIGETHDTDLVHGQSTPRRGPASVTEWSEEAKIAIFQRDTGRPGGTARPCKVDGPPPRRANARYRE